jgi:hypothetical protein
MAIWFGWLMAELAALNFLANSLLRSSLFPQSSNLPPSHPPLWCFSLLLHQMAHSSASSSPITSSNTKANANNRKRPFPFSIDSILTIPKKANTVVGLPNASKMLHWALEKAEIHLEGAALWRRFHALGTEMIVTRTGRRMFPTLQCSIRGLEADQRWKEWENTVE